METFFFPHLHVIGWDMQSHVTRSLQVKISLTIQCKYLQIAIVLYHTMKAIFLNFQQSTMELPLAGLLFRNSSLFSQSIYTHTGRTGELASLN